MKSFRLFATTDRHNHHDFDKLYACFVSYVGRERLRGNAVALSYLFDMASCRKEYDDILVKGTLDRSSASAVALIRTSIQQHAEKVAQAREDEPETSVTGLVGPSSATSTTSESHSPSLDDVCVEEDIDDLESADIDDRGHPIFFIFRALFDLYRHRPLQVPLRPSNLSEIQGMLVSFIVPKLIQFHSLKRVQK
ncbi:hypothetical protein BGZ81_004876 [Podila clonocystis]|nr:hypothetical protein BGZ81_004876 [Podila clonocystis]